MNYWKTWESKNNKYVVWYKKKPSTAFSLLWDLLQKKFMALVPFSSNEEDVLLDVGCGDGRYLISSSKSKGYLSVGIDPNNEVSLIPAKKRISEVGLDAFLVRGVGERIPLKQASVAVVLCNSALDHTLEPMVVLREIHRTLKEDGVLILWQGIYEPKHSEHDTHLRAFTRDSITTMLRNAGFSITNSSFLGCNLLPASESYESASSKIPQFLNKYLLTIIEAYLLVGKILPRFASIAMLESKKVRSEN